MNYASWGTRVGAYLVDGLIVLPFSLLAFLLDRPQVDVATGTTTGGGLIYYGLVLIGLVVSGYNRWYQAGKTGQSWGKKALGIKLVRESDGQPLGGGLAFGRDIAHLVDAIICYIGFLFPLWDAKRQTLADKIVKSVVVSA